MWLSRQRSVIACIELRNQALLSATAQCWSAFGGNGAGCFRKQKTIQNTTKANVLRGLEFNIPRDQARLWAVTPSTALLGGVAFVAPISPVGTYSSRRFLPDKWI